MKNNLSAGVRTLALTSLGFVLLSLVFLSTGCTSSQRSTVDSFLFTTTTNYTPRVVITTNNTTKTERLTNSAGAVEVFTVPHQIVTVQTNLTPVIDSVPSPAAHAWAGALANLVELFAPGVGKLTLLGATGALGIYGVTRRRRLNEALSLADQHEERADTMTAATETLAQTLEVFREVLKTTPQGQALNAKLTSLLVRNQVTADVVREVASVVAATVDNDKAKRAAQAILATLPSAPQSTPI